MSTPALILTVLFTIVSVVMILIILVQRSQGGGLAGAFGGAGGAGTDTVFGGRVGDALTWATTIAFALYLLFAMLLNREGTGQSAAVAGPASQAETTEIDPAAGLPPIETGAPLIPPPSGSVPPTDDATEDGADEG